MADENKVSVILPVFNGERFIKQAIQSVLQQTFIDFELIIIDDASTDNTQEVIRQFKDSRIRLISHKENKGVCAARNTGLEMARGNWLAPIDTDDVWHKERLARLLEIADKRPNIFIGSNIMLCFSGKNNELVPWKTLYEQQRLNRDYLFEPNTAEIIKYALANTWPIFPLEVMQKFNCKFRTEFRGHDWLMLILDLLHLGLKYIIVKEPLYFYRITSRSLSSSWLTIMTQLKACVYLQSTDWLDKESRFFIKKEAQILKYRLVIAAFREKKWDKALRHLIRSPLSIGYLLYRLPQKILQRWEFYNLSKKAVI